MRVTIVTNIPTAYRAPFYSEVHRRLKERGGRLTVVYGATWARDRQWVASDPSVGTAPSVVVPRAFVRKGNRQLYVNPLVIGAVERSRPDIVVLPSFAPWNYALAPWLKARGVPFLIWCGETPESSKPSSAPRRRPLISMAAGMLAYGPAARDYLVSIGCPEEEITVIGNGIDVDAFAARAQAARVRREETRRSLDLNGPTVLSVGGKGKELFGEVMRRSAGAQHLVVVGARDLPADVPGLVDAGRVPADRMPDFYAAADCLLHAPVFDQWPHAINESLSAGVPVVTVPATGVPDEAFTGPGCALVARDAGTLARAVDAALAIGAGTEELREAVRAPIRPWGVTGMAARWIGALDAAACQRSEASRR